MANSESGRGSYRDEDSFVDEDIIREEDIPEEIRVSIAIDELVGITREEAREIAEYYLEVLEEDLAEYVERTGTVFPEAPSKSDLKRQKYGLKDTDSASSFNSQTSDILPGEPSKVLMTFDRGVSVFPGLSLVHLAADEMVDAEVQVNIHRPKHHEPAERFSNFTQTIEMSFLPAEDAELAFRKLYPVPIVLEPLTDMSDKPESQWKNNLAMEWKDLLDSNKSAKSLQDKMRLIKSLKDEKKWTGTKTLGRFAKKFFIDPTGATIEHWDYLFKFDILYPMGAGFEGEWKEGRYKNGQITFPDGLEYSSQDWKYCEPPDRRFQVERPYSNMPAAKPLYSNVYPPNPIPNGMYEIGNGYFDPESGEVKNYEGKLMRTATNQEQSWIKLHCRRVPDPSEEVGPKFLPERFPGTYTDSQKRQFSSAKKIHLT